MNIFKRISNIGIKENMSLSEQKSIHILNNISLSIFLFFAVISARSYKMFDNPIIGHLYLLNVIVVFLAFFITKYKPEISKYLLSIFIPVSLVLGGAYAKSIGVTNNVILYLSPRMLLTISILIPVLIFGYREIKKTIIASIPGILVFIFYDLIHSWFGVHIKDLTFEPQFYAMFLIMIILFLFFEVISVLSLQKINLDSEAKLEDKNKALAASEEELTQQNEEILTINNNLVKQQKIILSQKEEMSKFQTAVGQSKNVIVITDTKGNIEYVNPAFCVLTGYSKDEVIGKNTRLLKSGKQSDDFYAELWKQISSGNVWEGEFQNKKKNGQVYWEQATITPIKNEKGEIINFVAIKDDISIKKEQAEKLNRAFETIKDKNKKITYSINYAKRIQNAVLPSPIILEKNFSEYFIIDRPTEIVSGDFYYFKESDNKILIAVADCTGHGVPGGFMTMLGHTILDEITKSDCSCNTGTLLDKMRNRIISTLGQNSGNTQDGMDMAICKIDKKTLQMQFSGANNPLLLISDKLKIIKGDRMPIGTYPISKPFQSIDIQLNKNDLLYMFSDGFQDQFGGKNDEKYYSRNFRNLLFSIKDKNLSEQKEIINTEISNWIGERSQIDDILILGLKI